ncbi:MAG: hypothetical protein V7746_18415 [Halioglobus sp.]
MSITKATRFITLTVILATYLSATIANAEPDKPSGKRRGPPPAAFEVCADQAEATACTFSGRHGDVTGSCIVPRQNDQENELVCAPEGGGTERQE